MIDDERFVIAEVAIGKAVHQTVGERVELLRCAKLRDARAASSAAGLSESGGCEVCGPGERGVGRRREVHVELPVRELVARRAVSDDVIGRAGRGQARSVDVGRQQSAEVRADAEALLGRRLAGQHARPVVGAGLAASEGVAVKKVEGDVVRVGPDRHLRIVGEVRVLEGVAVVGAGRITRLRDRDALQVWRRRHRELADDPAVGDRVVLGDRVAVVVGLAAAAKTAPQGVDGHRAVENAPGLVEDRKVGVDDLHHVVRPDCEVGIGWRGVDGECSLRSAEPVADAVE